MTQNSLSRFFICTLGNKKKSTVKTIRQPNSTESTPRSKSDAVQTGLSGRGLLLSPRLQTSLTAQWPRETRSEEEEEEEEGEEGERAMKVLTD